MGRQNRIAKAARLAPRPIGKLRPVVSCPTYKYNLKQRTGRGFTLEEIKAAGLRKKYKSKMILFPLNAKKPRKGDATPEELSKAVQLAGTKVMAVKSVVKRARAMAITEDMVNFKAFQTIRRARACKRLHGIRLKKAADAEADELSKKK